MICCVPGCQNDSNCKSQGITFHVFPYQPSLRSAWLQVVGKQLWELTEKTLVCSEHFLSDDFYTTKHGIRKLKVDAVPIVDQAVSIDEQEILKVCRICLTTEGKMYPIQNPKLKKAYQQLTGLSAVSEPYVPMQLCAECAHRAVGCSRLRDKALRAHRLVLNLLADHGALTKLNLKKINRLNNRLSSNLLIRHYPPNHADLHLDDNVDEQTVREIIDETFGKVKTDVSDDIDESSLDGEANKETDDEGYNLKDEHFEVNDVQSDDATDVTHLNQELNNDEANSACESAKDFPIPHMKKEAVNSDGDGMINEYFVITETTFDEELDIILKRKNSDTYKNSVFKCKFCYRGFSNESPYRMHMLRHTNLYGDKECDICKMHFRNRLTMKNHLKISHASVYSCKLCQYVTKYKRDARSHVDWHKGMRYECPYCSMVFGISKTLMTHVRKQHPSEFICEICGFAFLSERGIILHKQWKHTFDTQIPEDGPLCETCDIRFASVEAHNQHVMVSSRHTEAERRQLKKELDKSMRSIQFTKKRNKVRTPIKCEQCGIVLENILSYSVHFKVAHPDKNRTYYPTMKTKHMCEMCGKVFQNITQLVDHRWSHTGETPFPCDICGKAFKAKARMAAHRRRHNPDRATYACRLCGKDFSLATNRDRHEKQVHTNMRPFKCELCGKAFKSLREERSHVNYVHMKKPWPKRKRERRRVILHSTPESEPEQTLDFMEYEGDGDRSETEIA